MKLVGFFRFEHNSVEDLPRDCPAKIKAVNDTLVIKFACSVVKDLLMLSFKNVYGDCSLIQSTSNKENDHGCFLFVNIERKSTTTKEANLLVNMFEGMLTFFCHSSMQHALIICFHDSMVWVQVRYFEINPKKNFM